jgi:hypothetical protein
MKTTIYQVRHINTGTIIDIYEENSKTAIGIISANPSNIPYLKIGAREKIGVNTIGVRYVKL